MKTKQEDPINRAVSAIVLSKDINDKNIAYKKEEHRGAGSLKSALFLLLFFTLNLSYTISSNAASDSLTLSETGEAKLFGESAMLPTGDIDKADDTEDRVTIKVVSEEAFNNLSGSSMTPRVRNAIRTSDYYYTQLNDSDKLYYKAYLEAARANKGAVADLNEENASTYGTLVYSGSTIIDYPDWHSLGAAMEFDHPEELESILYRAKLFIFASVISGEIKYNYYLYFSPGSDYTGDQVAVMEEELINACNSFYNGLDLSGDDFSKELAIHDAIIEAMDYNYCVLSNNLIYDLAHTAYGAFVSKNPVCDGYSKAFKMLLDKAGIESHIVAGLGNGGGHAWNIVKIGNAFYEVDVTWDDQKDVSGYPYNYLLKHDYFNRTTEDFKNHSSEIPGYSGKSSHERDEKFLGYLEPDIAYGTEKTFKNEKQIYKLTFDGVASDVSLSLPYGEIYTYEGRIVELPAYVKRSGYTFDGWYDSRTGGNAITKDTVFGKATTVYARWTEEEYKIVFNAAGGSFAGGKSVLETDTTYGEVIQLSDVEVPSREGYEFVGWSKTEDSDDVLIEYKSLQDAVFYAVWTKKEVQNNEREIGMDARNLDTNRIFEDGFDDEINISENSFAREITGGDIFDELQTSGDKSLDETQGSGSETAENTKSLEDTESGEAQNIEDTESDESQNIEGTESGDVVQPQTTIQTVPAEIVPDNESSDSNKLVTALVNVSDSGKAYVVSPSGTASVGKTANKSITTVSIGKSVTYNGVSYNVTEIAKNAYKNCKKLSSLTIGANVESIGAKAFSGCKNLKKVTINGNNLKSVGKGSFKGIKSGAKIIIICKDKKTYNKLVKKLKKAGAQKANFKFKKG
ncbi:InlB B-repeat-containing protein [Butyrivibrio sp. VCD2006]|uniref:InlB B-repeat-containing protein n=1 Tax=Butyrivibrio sp. VCD2006 TaxID=1280664 RepID=UPI0003F74800|nr:InlB B-repeat-containing protein [Butyrivibrio sp. VCD2006]